MELLNTVSYDFPNFGLTHESNLNLIGLVLTSRKIKHKIPVNININSEEYVKSLPEEARPKCAEVTRELFDITDKFGLRYEQVTATVRILERGYKITLLCYGK